MRRGTSEPRISAVSSDGQNWAPFQTYEELKDRIDSAAAGAKAGALILGILDVAAGVESSRWNARAETISPYGVTTVRVSGVNQDARQEAINGALTRSGGTMAAIDMQHDAQVAALDAQALRTTTVAPGGFFGGIAVADAPKLDSNRPTPLLVRVTFLNDTHVLEFQAHRPGDYSPVTLSDANLVSALADETANNIPPASASTATETATADVPTQGDSQCTKDDEETVRWAHENGYIYHSPCESDFQANLHP